jgi:hypothetical protein
MKRYLGLWVEMGSRASEFEGRSRLVIENGPLGVFVGIVAFVAVIIVVARIVDKVAFANLDQKASKIGVVPLAIDFLLLVEPSNLHRTEGVSFLLFFSFPILVIGAQFRTNISKLVQISLHRFNVRIKSQG